MAFQLTTSQGGRPQHRLQSVALFHFNSQGGRHFRNHRPSCPAIISTHDLTRRSTRVAFRKNWKIKSFNSRPHEEVDAAVSQGVHGRYISTHDLTKRSTCRVAAIDHNCYFNSRPRKEVDLKGLISCHSDTLFQLTTSQGGRLLQCRLK